MGWGFWSADRDESGTDRIFEHGVPVIICAERLP